MTLIRYLTCSIVLFGLASTAQAAIMLTTVLGGSLESPPNASPGTGTAILTFDDDLLTMRLQTTFSNLTGTVTVAHIHAITDFPNIGTALVATELPTFVGFPSGVTSGSYDKTFDMNQATSYRAGFITANGGTPSAAYAGLRDASIASKSYLNIHTTSFPAGEIRGFFAAPEPSSLSMGMLLLGLSLHHRQRRKV